VDSILLIFYIHFVLLRYYLFLRLERDVRRRDLCLVFFLRIMTIAKTVPVPTTNPLINHKIFSDANELDSIVYRVYRFYRVYFFLFVRVGSKEVPFLGSFFTTFTGAGTQPAGHTFFFFFFLDVSTFFTS
jgi:hypothetical protein